jgi:hypothetical protein
MTVTLPDVTDVELGSPGEITINLLDADTANQKYYHFGTDGFAYDDLIAGGTDDGPPPVIGPVVELHPHNSKFKQPVVITFDLSDFLAELQGQVSQLREEIETTDLDSLKQRAALEFTAEQQRALRDIMAKGTDAQSRNAIVDMLASGEEDCTILMLRQSGTSKEHPWLPLEAAETLSVDANGLATVKLHSFSQCRICGKIGNAASWAATTVSKSVEGACTFFGKACAHIDTAAGRMAHSVPKAISHCPTPAMDCIIKYAAIAAVTVLGAATVATGGLAAIAMPVSSQLFCPELDASPTLFYMHHSGCGCVCVRAHRRWQAHFKKRFRIQVASQNIRKNSRTS